MASRVPRALLTLVPALLALPTTAGAQTVIGNGVITTDTVWDLTGSPYLLGVVRVAGTDGADGVTTLTIEAGVQVKGGWLKIGSTSGAGAPGALVADGGTGGSPILFTSDAAVPAPGDWCGLLFELTAHESTILRNARIEYAGQGCETNPAQLIDKRLPGTSITLDDVTFADSAAHDLKTTNADLVVRESTLESFNLTGSGSVSFDANTFVDWGAFLSTVNIPSVESLSHGNTFLPPPGEDGRVQVLNGTVELDASWGPDPGLYLMPFVTVAGTDGADGVTTLVLEPNMRMLFLPPAELRIGSSSLSGPPGRLLSDGGPIIAFEDAGVLMTSSVVPPSVGDWAGVREMLLVLPRHLDAIRCDRHLRRGGHPRAPRELDPQPGRHRALARRRDPADADRPTPGPGQRHLGAVVGLDARDSRQRPPGQHVGCPEPHPILRSGRPHELLGCRRRSLGCRARQRLGRQQRRAVRPLVRARGAGTALVGGLGPCGGPGPGGPARAFRNGRVSLNPAARARPTVTSSCGRPRALLARWVGSVRFAGG